jgi:flavin-dependent dehydrogenase
VEVREKWQVRALLRESDVVCGATGVDSRGAAFSLRSRVVIGADGLNSTVAARAGLTRRARWPRRIAFVAHFSGVSGVSDCGEMHVDRHGYLGIAPVDSQLTNVALVLPSVLAARRGRSSEQLLHDWIASRPYLADRFSLSRRVGPVTATGPFARSASRVWTPGVALAGDAAGFYDPFTGEGIYTALRSGELLAPHIVRQLESGSGDWSAMTQYEKARRKEFAGKLMVERLLALFVALPPLMNHASARLARRKHLADLLVGVTGDFVPAREVLRPRYLARMFF